MRLRLFATVAHVPSALPKTMRNDRQSGARACRWRACRPRSGQQTARPAHLSLAIAGCAGRAARAPEEALLGAVLFAVAASLLAQDRPELGVTGPVCAPIQHRAFWRLEPEQFGYRPRFVPGVVTFGPENRPYIRDGGAVQTLGPDGKWTRLDFTGCVQRAYPNWDGKFSTGSFAEEHVVFDTAGDAYLIVNATRSSVGQVLLLHSKDHCQSWTVYPLGRAYARLERSDGHNDLAHPPPILVYQTRPRGILELVVPKRVPGGGLDVSTRVTVSTDSHLVANHSGGGNSLCSQGSLIHVVWPGRKPVAGREKDGTPEYAATFDRRTGKMSEPVFLGLGGTGRPDNHNLPAIAADSEGYLQVVLGAHHDPFRYTRSLKPKSVTDGWAEPVEFGAPKPSPNDGSYTYASWLCDANDTLHCVARWAGAGYRFRLVYLRKRKGLPWDEQKHLVRPFGGNYSVYYHKLNRDRRGRLFVNYVYTRAARFADEVAAYSKKWPAEDASVSFIRREPCLLMSDDGGDFWRLAVTNDFTATPNVTSPAPTASPKEVPTIAATMLRQIGGAFGPVAVSGHTAYMGVGNSLLILDVSRPDTITAIGQSAPLADRIVDIDVKPPHVYVSAWRDGFVIYDVSTPARPRIVGRYQKTEARGAIVLDNLVYLTAAKGGLRVLDVSAPRDLREVGSLRSVEAYDVAVADGTAYLALGHGGMNVVDITDPTTPKEVSRLFRPADYSDRVNTAWYLVAAGERLYVSPGPADVCLRIFDVSKPHAPQELGQLVKTTWGWGRRAFPVKDRLYFPGLKSMNIIDVSDPTDVRDLGHAGPRASSVLAHGSRAYVTEGTSGLTIYDVSDAAKPRPLGHYEYPKLPFSVALAGKHAYVADWHVGLHVFDITDPEQPKAIGCYRKTKWAYGVAAQGQHAYVAAGKDGLAILDVSDPACPEPVGRLVTDTGIRDVAVLGRYAFLAEANTGIRIVDVSEPTRPVSVGRFRTPRQALGVAACDTHLFIAEAQWLKGGLRVCRISDTGRLDEIGCVEFDTDVWDVEVSGNRAYAALAKDGLALLDVSDLANIRILGHIQFTNAPVWSAPTIGDLVYAACGTSGLSVMRLPSKD